MPKTPNWIPPDPLIDFHDLQLPVEPDPARSFEIIGPAACRRISDGAELYLSAGESALLSKLGEGAIIIDGLSDMLRQANRLALAGLVDINYGDQTALRLHPRATVHDIRGNVTDQVLIHHAPRTMPQMRRELRDRRYVFTDDEELNLSPSEFDAAGHIRDTYIDNLRTYPGDKPADRRRLTGLICAHWILDGLAIGPDGDQQQLAQRLVLQQSPHSTVPAFDHDNISERPIYDWYNILDDPVLSRLCASAMIVLPEESRAPSTTEGVQVFETFSDIVTRGHNDGGVCNVLYCIDSDGAPDGAWTYVLDPDVPSAEGEMRFKDTPLFAGRLDRGKILIMADDKVGHYSTPNIPKFSGHSPSRLMVVVTVNRPETYREQLQYPYTDLLARFQPTG